MPDDRNRFRLFDYGKNRVWSEGLSFVLQIGFTMAGCIVFCFFVGLYLDRWLGAKGLLIAVFILLGVAGGATTVYRQIQETIEKDKTRERKPKAAEDDGRHP